MLLAELQKAGLPEQEAQFLLAFQIDQKFDSLTAEDWIRLIDQTLIADSPTRKTAPGYKGTQDAIWLWLGTRPLDHLHSWMGSRKAGDLKATVIARFMYNDRFFERYQKDSSYAHMIAKGMSSTEEAIRELEKHVTQRTSSGEFIKNFYCSLTGDGMDNERLKKWELQFLKSSYDEERLKYVQRELAEFLPYAIKEEAGNDRSQELLDLFMSVHPAGEMEKIFSYLGPKLTFTFPHLKSRIIPLLNQLALRAVPPDPFPRFSGGTTSNRLYELLQFYSDTQGVEKNFMATEIAKRFDCIVLNYSLDPELKNDIQNSRVGASNLIQGIFNESEDMPSEEARRELAAALDRLFNNKVFIKKAESMARMLSIYALESNSGPWLQPYPNLVKTMQRLSKSCGSGGFIGYKRAYPDH